MKINSMFFIAMCGLCISCGAEITTDTSSEVLSDRQIPIGISTVAVPEYGAETTRGLIANATYQLGLFRTGDKGYPPQYDAPYTCATLQCGQRYVLWEGATCGECKHD